MLILKRLSVWFVETGFEVLLLGLAIIGMFGYDQHDFGKSLGLAVGAIMLLSFTTGYLLTTAAARAAWGSRKLWSYSVVAIMLFLVHSGIFFLVSGADRHDLKNLSVLLAGCCVVFACTFIGSLVLRRWVPTSNHTT